jgi:hypothetical protein
MSELKAKVRSTWIMTASVDPRATFPAVVFYFLHKFARSMFCSSSSWRRNNFAGVGCYQFHFYFSQEPRESIVPYAACRRYRITWRRKQTARWRNARKIYLKRVRYHQSNRRFGIDRRMPMALQYHKLSATLPHRRTLFIALRL